MSSSITIAFSLEEGSITFNHSNASDIDKDLIFSVPVNTNLSGLTMNYNLSDQDSTVIQASFPEEDATFIMTDQPYIRCDRVRLVQGRSYTLSVTFSINGSSYTDTLTFVGDPPEQPYPSWTFDGEVWQPPTPMPISGVGQADLNVYDWDEPTLSWVPVGGYELE